MSQRYRIEYQLPSVIPHSFSNPIEITAAQLLCDTTKPRQVVRFKMKNCGGLTIRSLGLRVYPKKADGCFSEEALKIKYKQVYARPGAVFGQDLLVPLPQNYTTEFRVEVGGIVYLDGHTWYAPTAAEIRAKIEAREQKIEEYQQVAQAAVNKAAAAGSAAFSEAKNKASVLKTQASEALKAREEQLQQKRQAKAEEKPAKEKKPRKRVLVLIPVLIIALGVGGYFAFTSLDVASKLQKNTTTSRKLLETSSKVYTYTTTVGADNQQVFDLHRMGDELWQKYQVAIDTMMCSIDIYQAGMGYDSLDSYVGSSFAVATAITGGNPSELYNPTPAYIDHLTKGDSCILLFDDNYRLVAYFVGEPKGSSDGSKLSYGFYLCDIDYQPLVEELKASASTMKVKGYVSRDGGGELKNVYKASAADTEYIYLSYETYNMGEITLACQNHEDVYKVSHFIPYGMQQLRQAEGFAFEGGALQQMEEAKENLIFWHHNNHDSGGYQDVFEGILSAKPEKQQESYDYVETKLPKWDGSIAKEFNGGNGSEEYPYTIVDGSQLALLAVQVKEGNVSKQDHFKLLQDIDLNQLKWDAIGHLEKPFTGFFDGDGHCIYNLAFDTLPLHEENNGTDFQYYGLAGLFGNNRGSIENVKVFGKIHIDASSMEGQNMLLLGGLCALNNGAIRNAENYVSVFGVANENSYVDCGGVAGCTSWPDSVMDSCTNYAAVTAQGNFSPRAGGIAGDNDGYGMIVNCINHGSISAFGQNNTQAGDAGGITAHTWEAVIANCLNTGSVSAGGNAGGIAAYTNGPEGAGDQNAQDIQGKLENCISWDADIFSPRGNAGSIAGGHYNGTARNLFTNDTVLPPIGNCTKEPEETTIFIATESDKNHVLALLNEYAKSSDLPLLTWSLDTELGWVLE